MIIGSTYNNSLLSPTTRMEKYFSKFSLAELKQDLVAMAHAFDVDVKEAQEWRLPKVRERMVQICSDMDLLEKFVEGLLPNKQKLLKAVVWNNESSVRFYEEMFCAELVLERDNFDYRKRVVIASDFDVPSILLWRASPPWSYTRAEGNAVYINPTIRNCLIDLLGFPDDYQLESVPEKLIGGLSIWKNENILTQLTVLQKLSKEHNFKRNQSGFLSATDQKNLQKMLEIKSFPGNEVVKSAENQTKLLCRQWQSRQWNYLLDLFQYDGEFTDRDDGLVLLQTLQSKFCDSFSPWLTYFCNHLQKTDKRDKGLMSIEPFKDLFKMIQDFEEDTWYSHESLLRQMKYNGFQGWVVLPNLIYELRYTKVEPHFSFYHDIVDSNKYKVVYRAYMNSMLFFLSQLGLLEMAYGESVDTSGNVLQSFDYIDEMMYAFRLTRLGAYMIGKASVEDIKSSMKSQMVEEAPVVFSKTESLIRYKGDSPFTLKKIKSFSKPMKDGYFHVTAESVLSKCSNEDDLNLVLSDLESLADGSLPDFWRKFIDDLSQKVCKIEVTYANYAIVKLSDEEEVLRKLSRIKWITKSAELLKGGRILIEGDKVEKLVAEIRKQGLIVERVSNLKRFF